MRLKPKSTALVTSILTLVAVPNIMENSAAAEAFVNSPAPLKISSAGESGFPTAKQEGLAKATFDGFLEAEDNGRFSEAQSLLDPIVTQHQSSSEFYDSRKKFNDLSGKLVARHLRLD